MTSFEKRGLVYLAAFIVTGLVYLACLGHYLERFMTPCP
jgi:hypothetical protein